MVKLNFIRLDRTQEVSNFCTKLATILSKKAHVFLSLMTFLFFSSILTAQNTYTYQIIDAANNSVALSSFSGDLTWNLYDVSSINVVSNAGAGIYTKCRFTTVDQTKNESGHPYAYYGDLNGQYGLQNGVYYGWSPTVGTLFFTVDYFNGTTITETDTFTITFVNNPPDTTPPSPVPSNVVANNPTASSVDLSWSGSTDSDSGLKEYIIRAEADGTGGFSQVGTDTGLSTTITGLSPDTQYQFTISAIDNATPGNESAQSVASTSITTLSNGSGSGGYWSSPNGSQDINYTAGSVGIGTGAIVNYKLAVDGKIRSREVKVDNDNWADYVFHEDYKLPTLKEVEQHIKEKGHLINIPSAKEVHAEGIELGEMNKLLLEKIEELTLYLIQQRREIQILKKEIQTK